MSRKTLLQNIIIKRQIDISLYEMQARDAWRACRHYETLLRDAKQDVRMLEQELEVHDEQRTETP